MKQEDIAIAFESIKEMNVGEVLELSITLEGDK